MPRDVNGSTQPLPGTIVATGDTILPSQHNPMVVDLYSMMSQSLSRDGQGGMRSNLDMSGFKVANVGTAVLDTDAVSLAQSKRNGVPIGAILDYVSAPAPEGWLLCYGQELSRADYAALFAIISTTFGAGNGSTTFNIPDYRGRVGAGQDDMGGVSADRLTAQPGGVDGDRIGSVGGSESHTLVTAQLAEHAHAGTTATAGSHFHSGFFGETHTGSYSTTGGQVSGARTITDSAGSHQHTFTTNPSGGGQPHNNVQPTIIVNKIIKVSY